MKHSIILLVMILLFSSFVGIVSGVDMDTVVLYERYIKDGGTLDAVFDERWFAQTFTIGNTGSNISHNITSVKLLMRRVGTIGWFNVNITATDISGYPTGENLSWGTYDGDTLLTSTEFIEINLTSYTLIEGTKYAIVVENSDQAGGGSILEWRRADVHGYTGGVWCYSTDYGASWGVNTGRDFTFYEFGFDVEPEPILRLTENFTDPSKILLVGLVSFFLLLGLIAYTMKTIKENTFKFETFITLFFAVVVITVILSFI